MTKLIYYVAICVTLLVRLLPFQVHIPLPALDLAAQLAQALHLLLEVLVLVAEQPVLAQPQHQLVRLHVARVVVDDLTNRKYVIAMDRCENYYM